MSSQNERAKKFAQLHQPGNPVLLVNSWDVPSAKIAAENPRTKVIATTSFAIAAVAGSHDTELTWEEHFDALKKIAGYLKKAGKLETIPLTVDFQDGYGDRLEEALTSLIDIGVVGINLEDSFIEGQGFGLRSIDEQVERIKRVKKLAASKGVPDFFINARIDAILASGHDLDEVIARGKAFLAAGAGCIFAWGGPSHISKRPGGGLRDAEVVRLVKELDGKVNVVPVHGEGGLTVKEMSNLGVARISLGPDIWFYAMDCVTKKTEELLESLA